MQVASNFAANLGDFFAQRITSSLYRNSKEIVSAHSAGQNYLTRVTIVQKLDLFHKIYDVTINKGG